VSVTQEAIDKIKSMIISGEFRPGARLPKEADLAGQLGLSRNSLREAVRALTLIHILETRQGDGTYVTSLEPDVLLATMTFVGDFHQDASLLHVFQVRRILEAAATSLAAQFISEDELQTLGELLDGMESCETVEGFVELDLAFHNTIAVASRNPVLASLLESFANRTSRARLRRGIAQGDAIEQTKAHHRAIHESLRQHRPDIAGGLAVAHIASVEAWFEHAHTEA
jgi:GntR family transcriptional regulator, transcriptional repressor for pyruvate dehydrogenase complex